MNLCGIATSFQNTICKNCGMYLEYIDWNLLIYNKTVTENLRRYAHMANCAACTSLDMTKIAHLVRNSYDTVQQIRH